MALPADKAGDPFGLSDNDPRNDCFDQYLNFDTGDIIGSFYLAAHESTHLDKPTNVRGAAGTLSSTWGGRARHSQGDPLNNQNPASSQRTSTRSPLDFQQNLGRASIVEPDQLSLSGISLQSPQVDRFTETPPSPKSPVVETLRGRGRFLKRFSRTFRKGKESEDTRIRKSSPIRKATCPPKMMQLQYSEQNLHDMQHRLGLDAVKFDFGFQNNSLPLSPPPSTRFSEASVNGSNIMPGVDHNCFAWDPLPQQYACRDQTDLNQSVKTPPASDATSFRQANVQQVSSHNMIYPSCHRNYASASWAPAPVTSDYGFEASTPYVQDEVSAPLWWDQPVTGALSQPSSSAFHRPSQHRNNTKSLALQLHAELAYNSAELSLSPSSMPSGLMIQLPHSPTRQAIDVDTSPMSQGQAQQSYFEPTASASQASQPHQPTPHHQHRYTQSQPQPLPLGYPSPRSRPKTHSRTTSSSPSSPSPRSRASSFHVTKRRSFSRRRPDHGSTTTKASKSGRGNGATGGNGAATGMVDFVNFTPDDSMKILTGVAPSGSSKTKARREKEAMEKTRRLSQAAVRAVRAAGGSIEGLVEEGLLVSPN